MPGQGSLFSSDDLMTTERGTGRLSGLEFLHVHARRIINEVPAASRMPFRFTINAYRGCSPRVYVLLRPADPRVPRPRHRRGLRAPDRGEGQRGGAAAGRAAQSEVDRRVDRDGHQHRPLPAVRGEVPADPRDRRGARPRRATRSPSSPSRRWCCATSTCWPRRPERTAVSVSLSIGTLDEAVWRATEPGAPHPRRRVDAVRQLSEAGHPHRRCWSLRCCRASPTPPSSWRRW